MFLNIIYKMKQRVIVIEHIKLFLRNKKFFFELSQLKYIFNLVQNGKRLNKSVFTDVVLLNSSFI